MTGSLSGSSALPYDDRDVRIKKSLVLGFGIVTIGGELVGGFATMIKTESEPVAPVDPCRSGDVAKAGVEKLTVGAQPVTWSGSLALLLVHLSELHGR